MGVSMIITSSSFIQSMTAFFRAPETTEEEKISIPFKVVQERNTYKTVLPNEMILQIFKLLDGQTRLCILPQVCYQFYEVSRPFSGKCYQLHNLIYPACNSIESVKMGVHIVQFRNDQTLSVYNILAYPNGSKQYSMSEFKSHVCSLKNDDDNNFDVLTFYNRLKDRLQIFFGDDCYFRLNHYFASNEEEYLLEGYFEDLKELETLEYLRNIDDDVLENIASIIIGYGQHYTLTGCFDRHEFEIEVLGCLKENHRELLQVFSETGNKGFIEMIGLRYLPHYFNMEDNNIKYRNGIEGLITLATLPFQKCIKRIKQNINDSLRGFFFECSYKSSLIFISTGDNIKEISKSLFSKAVIHYSTNLEQVHHDPELAEEYQWFADKLIKITNS